MQFQNSFIDNIADVGRVVGLKLTQHYPIIPPLHHTVDFLLQGTTLVNCR